MENKTGPQTVMNISKVHVVDRDSRRRARLSYVLAGTRYQAQVYESLEEFTSFGPSEGLVLANDDDLKLPLPTLKSALRQGGSDLPIALYSSRHDTERIVEAVFSGALDYLVWPIESGDLEAAFERIAQRIAQSGGSSAKEAAAHRKVETLSPREREVLALLTGGFSNREMGEALGISVRTVEIHRANLFRKLEAGSTAEAVAIGIYAGVSASQS